MKWPPEGIVPFDFSSIPLLNTLLLLGRGVQLTSAHIFYIKIQTFIPTLQRSTTISLRNEYIGVDPLYKDEFDFEKSFTEFIKAECEAKGYSHGPNRDGTYSAYYHDRGFNVIEKDYFVHAHKEICIVDNRAKVIFTEYLFFRIYPVFELYCHDVDGYGHLEDGLGIFFDLTLELIVDVLILGVLFTLFQIIEYIEAYFSIIDGVYGRTFFIATGFHGFHVLVGTLFL